MTAFTVSRRAPSSFTTLRPFSSRESQLAREAVQLKQTLELGKHVRREIEKEQMKKDTPEGMLS